MKLTQFLTTICCIIVAFMITSGVGQPWRPQGRFGKRISQGQNYVEDATPDGEFELLTLPEVPVEFLLSHHVVTLLKKHSRLCSISGFRGFPVCKLVTLPSSQQSDDIDNQYDL